LCRQSGSYILDSSEYDPYSRRSPSPPRPAPVHKAAAKPPTNPNKNVVLPFRAIPRSQWAKRPPNTARLNPMRKVARITVHHEGWKPVWFTDYQNTAERLELIRVSHINRMRAGDIGYHFIVDRNGRVWEGRSLRFQGAHVKNHNQFNVGVMVLGNFDKQAPSSRQLVALQNTLATLMKKYRVPTNRVYTHQELNPTACPGRNLQPRMVSLRNNGYLA